MRAVNNHAVTMGVKRVAYRISQGGKSGIRNIGYYEGNRVRLPCSQAASYRKWPVTKVLDCLKDAVAGFICDTWFIIYNC